MHARWQALGSGLKTALWWTPVALTVNDCLVGAATIDGSSMQPALNPGGPQAIRDRVLVDKLSSRIYTYKRGDVVVLRSPRHPKKLLVKRLIGLEGDWLLVSGRKDIVKVPKGQCWIEGDNAACSEDSASVYGPVPLALIQGRVLGVFWPPARIAPVHSHMPHGKLLMRADAADGVRYTT